MKAPQKIAEAIGASGCYFLSILHLESLIDGGSVDPFDAYNIATARGYMREDCYILDPAAVLGFFNRDKWEVFHATPEYLPKPGELEILRFERVPPGMTYSHFVVGDGKGAVAFDPYGVSRTVRDGALVSKRIFKRKEA